MDGILIRERYKVVQVLWRAENYAAVEVVDIQERENPSLLVSPPDRGPPSTGCSSGGTGGAGPTG